MSSIGRVLILGNPAKLGWGFSITLPCYPAGKTSRRNLKLLASSRIRGMGLGNSDDRGNGSPSETSPLLANADGKTSDGRLTIVPNEPVQEPAGSNGRIGDEEAPEMGQAPNPLMEGLPEVAAKMHILLPAVGVGVSVRILLSRCYKSNQVYRSSSLHWTRPSSSLHTPKLAAR